MNPKTSNKSIWFQSNQTCKNLRYGRSSQRDYTHDNRALSSTLQIEGSRSEEVRDLDGILIGRCHKIVRETSAAKRIKQMPSIHAISQQKIQLLVAWSTTQSHFGFSSDLSALGQQEFKELLYGKQLKKKLLKKRLQHKLKVQFQEYSHRRNRKWTVHMQPQTHTSHSSRQPVTKSLVICAPKWRQSTLKQIHDRYLPKYKALYARNTSSKSTSVLPHEMDEETLPLMPSWTKLQSLKDQLSVKNTL
ncbi:hypothetical protein Tco_0795222 [Tanacetum coccineum]